MALSVRDTLEDLQTIAAAEERRIATLEEELTVLRARVDRERGLQARLGPLHRSSRMRRVAFIAALLAALGATLVVPRVWPWSGLSAGKKPAYTPPPQDYPSY